ncbi:hypothetical protein MTP99_019712 [Tenebrio molitor]|nr:hypothetical protein MTP99_019712 [Tenebrio molitor]
MSYALSTPASGMANRTKVASISASVQRARVHFGEPCNKRAFILAIHLLSVFENHDRKTDIVDKVWIVFVAAFVNDFWQICKPFRRILPPCTSSFEVGNLFQ